MLSKEVCYLCSKKVLQSKLNKLTSEYNNLEHQAKEGFAKTEKMLMKSVISLGS